MNRRYFRNNGITTEVRLQPKDGRKGRKKHNPDGLDEIVVLHPDFDFHLEEMDTNFWWFNVAGVGVWLRAKGPIEVYWAPQGAEEISAKKGKKEAAEQQRVWRERHPAVFPTSGASE